MAFEPFDAEVQNLQCYFVLIIELATLRKNLSMSDFNFSQVTEVEKREPRKSFLKPKPDFWGRGRRPRPRNEQAEAEKCFRSSLFSTEVTLEIQITRGLIFSRTIASTIIETECFFHFSGFFVNIKEKLNISFYSIFPL